MRTFGRRPAGRARRGMWVWSCAQLPAVAVGASGVVGAGPGGKRMGEWLRWETGYWRREARQSSRRTGRGLMLQLQLLRAPYLLLWSLCVTLLRAVQWQQQLLLQPASRWMARRRAMGRRRMMRGAAGARVGVKRRRGGRCRGDRAPGRCMTARWHGRALLRWMRSCGRGRRRCRLATAAAPAAAADPVQSCCHCLLVCCMGTCQCRWMWRLVRGTRGRGLTPMPCRIWWMMKKHVGSGAGGARG